MSKSRFRAAVESGDIDAVVALLSRDVVFHSPVVFTPYTDIDSVALILRAVFEVFEDFRYVDEVIDPDREVLMFEARVGDRAVEGVDIIRLDERGQVSALTVMVRPMTGMMALAEAMRERLSRAAGG